jgi:predicted N-formylglutamate amidohydrolase
MAGRMIADFDELIAMIRQNINELVEQAAAYSGAEDEERTANRIAEQERKLATLIELRDALTRS